MEEQGTILIVDDEEINIEVLGSALESEYKILFALNGAHALHLAEAALPDLILLDVRMPDMDGYAVCAHLRHGERTAEIPVIFVTALIDQNEEIKGFAAGAVDYVTKPLNPLIVKARIRTHVELKRARDKLAQLATTDGLTGLANRRRFDQMIEAEVKRMRRTEQYLSLIMLDIDHFKKFNDTYGHVAGDDCLRRVAQVLAQVVNRASDLPARYGGEEFACILPETDLQGALAVARRVHAGIAELGIAHAGSSARHVTASLGVAASICLPSVSSAKLIATADECLYKAKAAGRDRIATSMEP